MTTSPYQRQLSKVREREHRCCFVCDPDNHDGFGLDFRAVTDGNVTAVFSCKEVFSGYPRRLHGGVISALLDGAMTNCLFARGIVAVTAELSVRFRAPVVIDQLARVRAWLEESHHPLYLLRAELYQGGETLVTASGKFMIVPQDEDAP